MSGLRAARAAIVVVAFATVASACGGGAARPVARGGDSREAAPTGGWIGADGEMTWHSDTASSGESVRGVDDLATSDVEGAVTTLPGAGGFETTPDEGVPLEPTPDDPPVDPAVRAGSVDDNERWDDYLRFREQFLAAGIEIHDVDVSTRRIVRVVTADGTPVLGATVKVYADGELIATRTTYADGRVIFYPEPNTGQDPTPELRVEVTKGEKSTEAALDSESLEQAVTFDAPDSGDPVPLDVLFLIDATGSMSDEIEQLKANMISVAEQLDVLDPRPDVRFAMTVYRDRGDLFVTRTFDFTPDVAQFTDALRDVVADGGGDTPESLNAGLHDALEEPAWRGPDAVKLVFLIADAAPHLDYPDDADYAVDMQTAADRGVKIHPIASSGLDDQGEYVMRQLAQYTTGRFNFLTYGADGASPGDSTTHHVDDYAVLSLDELVVRLVTDELEALTKRF